MILIRFIYSYIYNVNLIFNWVFKSIFNYYNLKVIKNNIIIFLIYLMVIEICKWNHYNEKI